MSVMLPTEMLPIAGPLVLPLVWPRFQTQPSNDRFVAEALGMTLAAVAIVRTAWFVL